MFRGTSGEAPGAPALPAAAPPASPPPPADGVVRLPIEAAKKLRWYDQHDVKMLIQLHLREKAELHQANAVLRGALGPTHARAAEAAAANDAVDRMRAADEALNGVLVLAAAAEVERLQEEVAALRRAAQVPPPLPADNPEPLPPGDEHPGPAGDAVVEAGDAEKSPRSPPACPRCSGLANQAARLSAALADAEQQLAASKERHAESAAAQMEVVKLAQDERLAAETRREEAEARAAAAAAEAKAAKERAERAEAALGAERSKGTARADAGAAAQRQRIAELEASAGSLSQQLAAAQARGAAAEERLGAAEAEAERAVAEARDLEAAAAERDALAARLAAAEARLEEGRSVALSSSSLREVASQAEARRLAAEEELVATATLAAELEERLVRATATAEAAALEVQAAEGRAAAAWGEIEAGVARRWAEAGADRRRWPAAAQEEVEAVEARLTALNAAHKNLQEKLGEAERAAAAAGAAAAAAGQRAAAAEAAADRVARSAEQREARLEAAALAATRQVDEFRAALARLERERDAAAAAATAAEQMSPRGGGGGPPRLKEGALDPTDLVYLRNVLLRFMGAHLEGRAGECEVLLPALAAVLRASPGEFKALKEVHDKSHAVFGGWV